MNRDDDLPLFGWTPPECAILPFPQKRRAAKIRQTASTLISASTEKQLAHWREQIFGGIENGFLRLGFEPEVAKRERDSFIDAVEREISRRTYGRPRSEPDSGESA